MKTAILAVIMFALMIFPHELGHFIVAKLFGIKVNEFAFGMGPAIWKKQGKETLYSIRIFPIGGYNAIEGEDGESESERAFCNKPWYARILVLFAGSFMNIVIAVLVMILMVQMAGFATTTLDTVLKDSPAKEAGLQAGDEVLAVGGKKISQWNDIGTALSDNQEKAVTVIVKRGTEEKSFTMTPKKSDGRYRIGILPVMEHSLLRSVKYGFIGTGQMFTSLLESLKQLVRGGVSPNDVAGPVGMVSIVHQTESLGISAFLYLLALVSLNLAIINLLPLPALDGGRIIFVLIRAVTGKAITDKQEGMVHGIGMMLLLFLMVLVTWNDIVRLFH